jgi:hypothetical protein
MYVKNISVNFLGGFHLIKKNFDQTDRKLHRKIFLFPLIDISVLHSAGNLKANVKKKN